MMNTFYNRRRRFERDTVLQDPVEDPNNESRDFEWLECQLDSISDERICAAPFEHQVRQLVLEAENHAFDSADDYSPVRHFHRRH